MKHEVKLALLGPCGLRNGLVMYCWGANIPLLPLCFTKEQSIKKTLPHLSGGWDMGT